MKNCWRSVMPIRGMATLGYLAKVKMSASVRTRYTAGSSYPSSGRGRKMRRSRRRSILYRTRSFVFAPYLSLSLQM
jgi:hypothetical protein